MQIFKRIEDFQAHPSKPLVLALGFFDGVHLGHQKILDRVKKSALSMGAVSAVFTFENHPQTVLRPDLPPPLFLTSREHKLHLLNQAGVQICFLMPFSQKFSQQKAEVFVQEILVKQLHMKKMCLGYNAHFGHGRSGNPDSIKRLAKELHFEFEEIAPVEIKTQAVSSSRIRKLVQKGNLDEAGECLGRPYSLWGEVIAGEGRGKELGFPTANLETKVTCLPPEGVYPVEVRHEKNLWRGVLNFGKRPTFGAGKASMEVHLLNFQGNLYGTTLEIIFYPRLRAEQAFSDAKALRNQISRDIQSAQTFFKNLFTRQNA